MFLVTPATVLNPSALETLHIPRRFPGRSLLVPVRRAGLGLIFRVIFEVEVLRYLAALLPFAGAAGIWPEKVIAIAQAPLRMFMVVYALKMRFLRLTPEARRPCWPRVRRTVGLTCCAPEVSRS